MEGFFKVIHDNISLQKINWSAVHEKTKKNREANSETAKSCESNENFTHVTVLWENIMCEESRCVLFSQND